jgi:Reverse transcriptase (RNA-dependent DNA polymerase)
MSLNELAEKDSYSLPEMRKIVQATQGSNYLTVLDLKDAYYHVEITEEHKEKTAFEINGRVYEWCGMVMGYKNGPMIFQRIMDKILDEVIGKEVEVYLDDIIMIHAENMRRMINW